MKTNEAALGADNSHELNGLTVKQHRPPVIPVIGLKAESQGMHAEVVSTTREAFRP